MPRPAQAQTDNEPNKLGLGVAESKRDKTRRLANQRGRKLIDYMQSLGRLGNPAYDLGEENTEKLIAVLTREFNFMVEQLRHGAGDPTNEDLI